MKGVGGLLLYLDFDGVLHHENVLWHPGRGAYLAAPEGFKIFQHVALLDELLSPYPNVRIVLSTSWVLHYGCTKSARNLSPALQARVVGATYHSRMCKQEFRDMPRGQQVWSDALRRKPRDWLALDDQDENWPHQCRDKLVRTHDQLGLSHPPVIVEIKRRLKELCA